VHIKLLLVLFLFRAFLLPSHMFSASDLVTIDVSSVLEPLEIGRYGLGQGGLSGQPMFEAHVDAIRWLHVKLIRLFVQEYFDVYPAHGVYHWITLDRAIDTILKTGASPLLSICIKPKTLYPQADQDKVHPTSYEEWERLIYQMVRHYNVERKCGMRYWEVFNEPDIGEDGGCPSRFQAQDYVKYYEHTARAIKRADPTAKVGGPALASWRSPLLKALLQHCASTGTPLDFVSWHVYNNDPLVIRRTIDSIKALLREFPQLRCETILDEWNMSLSEPRLEPGYQPSFIIDTVAHMREAGLDYAAYYHIRDYHVSERQFLRFMSFAGAMNMANWWNLTPQYDGLFDFQGVMRPSYFAFKMLSRLNGNRLETVVTRPGVKALAAFDPEQNMMHALVWNFAVEAPALRNIRLLIRNFPGQRCVFRRFLLDTETASNQENDRVKVQRSATFNDTKEMTDVFDLPPYGIALIVVCKLGGNS